MKRISQPKVNVIPSTVPSTSGDEFVGFPSVVSPSQPRLKIFNRPMVVCDYKALPNDKFKLIHDLIAKVHPGMRTFIKIV